MIKDSTAKQGRITLKQHPEACSLRTNYDDTTTVSGRTALILIGAASMLRNEAGAATFYVSATGSDSANGLTPSTSWLTIEKVNKTKFSPGDAILFKRGDAWRKASPCMLYLMEPKENPFSLGRMEKAQTFNLSQQRYKCLRFLDKECGKYLENNFSHKHGSSGMFWWFFIGRFGASEKGNGGGAFRMGTKRDDVWARPGHWLGGGRTASRRTSLCSAALVRSCSTVAEARTSGSTSRA